MYFKNKKSRSNNFITVAMLTLVNLFTLRAQCPTVDFMNLDACSVEATNEYVIIFSGAGFNTANLTIDFDDNNNVCAGPGSMINNDIGVDVNNCATNLNPCGLQPGNPSAFSGCTNIIAVGPGFDVPANSILIIQVSDGSNTTGVINLAPLCGMGQCVYVIESTCTRGSGAFSNSASAGTRTTNFDFGSGCTESVTYDCDDPSYLNTNGAGFIPSTNSFTAPNITCQPTIINPAPLPASVDQPSNVMACSNELVEIDFTGSATDFSWTNSNTNIGLGSSGTGDISFTSSIVSTTQVGTIVVTPIGACPGMPKTFTITINPNQDPSFSFVDWCEGDPNGPTGIITLGGTFSFNPIPGGGVTINPSTGVITNAVNNVIYTVQYTTPGPCPGTQTTEVMQLPAQSAAFTFADFCLAENNGPVITGVPGGTFSFNPTPTNGTSINPATGEIFNESVGTYTVQYTTPGPCPSTSTDMVTVLPPVNIVLPSLGPYCINSPTVALPSIISGVNGTWSGPGVTGTTFNPMTAGAGTHMLTFTPTGSPCALPISTNVLVNPSPSGNLSGMPVLCPGQCGVVSFEFVGGSGIFNVGLNIMAGPFNFSFTIPGATNTTVLTLCLSNALPPFNAATNTLNIPTFVPPGTYSLTLTSITDPTGPCPNGTVGTPGTLSITIQAAPTANDASITVCDLDGDGMGTFDLTTLNSTVSPPPNTVTWYSNSALTNLIANPSAFVAGNNTQVFAQVTTPDGCENDAIISLLLQMPTVLNINDFNSCVNGPIINLPLINGGVSGLWSGPNVINGGTQFDPTGLSVGSYTITFTANNPALCIAPAIVDVIISAGQPITILDPISTSCLGDGNIILPLDIGGVPGIWSGSVFLTGNVFNVIASGPGTFSLTFTPTGGCFSANTTNLVVNPNINVTPVTFPPVCTGGPVVILPNSVDGYPGTWTGGQGVSGNMFNPNLPPGTYLITFNPNNPCVSTFTSGIVVTTTVVLTPPSIGPTCVNGTPITLPTNITGINGTWTYNGNAITVFNPATFGLGNFSLTFTPVAGACANPITITVSVGAINAGADQNRNICLAPPTTTNLNSFLSSNASAGGVWSFNNINITNPTSVDLAAYAAGANIFRYIVSNPQCGNDTAFVTLNLGVPNNAGVPSASTTLCQNASNSVNIGAILGPHDNGGQWVTPMGTSVNFSNLASVNLSALSGMFNLLYIIQADLCPADTAQLTFNITPFSSAGPDVNPSICIGTQLDLATLIAPINSGGGFSNPNAYPGFVGNTWNTTGATAGIYSFLYTRANALPCKNDTALLTVNLVTSVLAGQDQGAFYCEDDILTLSKYIDPSGAQGGTFYRNNVEVVGGSFNTTGLTGSLVFTYVVGGGNCPMDTAFITLQRINQPQLIFNPLPPICEDDCTTLKIEHLLPVGTVTNFRLINSNGQALTQTVTINNTDPILLQFCGASMPPYNFMNLVPNLTYTVFLDSLVLPGVARCNFDYGQLVSFFVRPRATKTVNGPLCKGTTITIGNTTFSETKLTGTAIISVPPNIGCDTVVTVNFTLVNPSAPVTIKRTTCNNSFSVQVGSTTFNKSNPNGNVTLKNKAGCDSLVNVDLIFINPPQTNFAFTTCDPTYSVMIGGQTFNTTRRTGIATIVNGSVFGCDSTVNVNLTFLPVARNDYKLATCDPAFSYTVGGQTFNLANPIGSVTLSKAAANGCDSIVDVELSIKAPASSVVSIATCDPTFSRTVGNQTFNLVRPSGIVTLAGAAASGCDSIVDVKLDFSTFSFSHSLIYDCDMIEPTINVNLTSHPGPYKVTLNNTVQNNQSLPYNAVMPIGQNVLIFETPQGCKDTLKLDVASNAGPIVELTQVEIEDCFTQINVVAPANIIYDLSWSPSTSLSCDDCFDPVANAGPTTTYTLSYSYGNMCEDSVSIEVVECKKIDIVLPNIIRPNSNGGNGTFYVNLPEELTGTVKQMSIYDRWGNLVFNVKNVPTNDPSAGWKADLGGTLVEQGVYVYYVELLLDGKPQPTILKGDLTVIR